MTIAPSAKTRLAVVNEAPIGTTPANPSMQELRITRENLQIKKMFAKSQQFTSTMTYADQIPTHTELRGGWAFEASHRCFDDVLMGVLRNNWVTNAISNGSTHKALTAEVKYESGATDLYKVFKGLYINELNLSMPLNQIATGDVSCMAIDYSQGGAGVTLGTGAYVAAGTTTPYSTSELALLGTGGSTTLTVDKVMNISAKINGNLREQRVLDGSGLPASIGFGMLDIGGSIEMYLDATTHDAMTRYLANSAFNLTATLGSVTAEKTKFEFFGVKLANIEVSAEGLEGDVMVKGEWSAYGSGTLVTVTRNVT